jgi:hypothetical protein
MNDRTTAGLSGLSKMTTMDYGTIHRCGKCGIEPEYQTAKATEQLDDVPNVVYRLQCPNCGRFGGFCTSKQCAADYWNRETFNHVKGHRK